MASISSVEVEDSGVDATLELSLGWSSMKRVREGDESVEEKKPKLEGLMPYGIQVIPMILQGSNGYYNDHVMPCWVPSSEDVVEIGINMSDINRNQQAVERDGVIAGDFHLEVANDALLNLPKCSNSGTSVFQSFSDKDHTKPQDCNSSPYASFQFLCLQGLNSIA